MKKQELYFDSIKSFSEINEAQQAVIALNEAIEKFNELQCGKMDAVLFQKCKTRAADEALQDAITAFAESKFKKIGCSSPEMVEDATRGVIKRLHTDVAPLFVEVRGRYFHSLGFVSFADGKAVLLPETIEHISTKNTIYAETPEAQQLYDLQHEIREKLTLFCQMADKDIELLPTIFPYVFRCDKKGIHCEPLNYNVARSIANVQVEAVK